MAINNETPQVIPTLDNSLRQELPGPAPSTPPVAPAAPMAAQVPAQGQEPVQVPNPEPSTLAKILGATGNFFNHVPILNLLSAPWMGDATRNAVQGYADYVSKYGQAADAAKRKGQKLPPRQGLMDYLKDRNLYSDFMSDPRNRRAGWLDQAHLYHEQGNQEAATTALKLAGDTENQVQMKIAQWDIHHFMRNNGPELNKLLASHDYNGVMDLLKKGGPEVQQILGPQVLKEQDKWYATQSKLGENALTRNLLFQSKNQANQTRQNIAQQKNATSEDIAKQNNDTKLQLARINASWKALAGKKGTQAAKEKDALLQKSIQMLTTSASSIRPGDMTATLTMAKSIAQATGKTVPQVFQSVGISFNGSGLTTPNALGGVNQVPLGMMPPDVQKEIQNLYQAPGISATVSAPMGTVGNAPVSPSGQPSVAPTAPQAQAPTGTPGVPTLPGPLTKSGPMDEKEMASHLAPGKRNGNSIIYPLKDPNLDAATKLRLIQGLKRRYPTANISMQNNIITVSAK